MKRRSRLVGRRGIPRIGKSQASFLAVSSSRYARLARVELAHGILDAHLRADQQRLGQPIHDHVKNQKSPVFDAKDADVVSRSCPDKSGFVTDFRVFKQDLANSSPVFRDMFVLGDSQDSDQDRPEGLPVVQLEESEAALLTLLPYVQGDIDNMADVDGLISSAWLHLWDASLKYRMCLLQMLVEGAIRHHLASKDATMDFALGVLQRAGRYCRPVVEAGARSRLLKLDPSTFLLKLLEECDSVMLAELFAAIHGRGSSGPARSAIEQARVQLRAFLQSSPDHTGRITAALNHLARA